MRDWAVVAQEMAEQGGNKSPFTGNVTAQSLGQTSLTVPWIHSTPSASQRRRYCGLWRRMMSCAVRLSPLRGRMRSPKHRQRSVYLKASICCSTLNGGLASRGIRCCHPFADMQRLRRKRPALSLIAKPRRHVHGRLFRDSGGLTICAICSQRLRRRSCADCRHRRTERVWCPVR